MIVLTVAIAASLFLMTFVVPRILEPLIEQGQELPLPTRVVKSVSDFIVGWWWLIAAPCHTLWITLIAFGIFVACVFDLAHAKT